MSAIQPPMDVPVPNYAAEEAAKPYETDRPVAAANAAAASEAVEAEENRAGYAPAEDAVDISNAARARAETRYSRRARDEAEREADPLDAEFIRDNLGIRELIRSFENYDNGAARARYDAYLDLFARYGAADAAARRETGAVNALRERENAAYDILLFGRDESGDIAARRSVEQAIDRWFAGTGVFSPNMPRYSSSDGFRFTPVGDAAQAATRANDVLASYERGRIAQYLREMARLTPADFMFRDAAGLGELALDQRREFLRRMDELLVEAEVEAIAGELRYVFDENGKIQLDELGLGEEYVTALDRLREEINTYYGQLRYLTYQYKSGIVSSALGE